MPRLVWDRFAIKAEVARRGSSLTRVALDAGLEPSACRKALIRRCHTGELALSRFLGVALIELWPQRYRGTTSKAGSTAPRGRGASPNRTPNPDTGAAA